MSDTNKSTEPTAHRVLTSYVMAYVEEWAKYRQVNYRKDWHYYYRIWRGIWKATDRDRQSERSHLISPATQQAIEIQVSEMEEATFNKKNWFDLSDDIADPDKEEMGLLRDQLLEDMELCGVPAKIAETYLVGAIYGNGIGKIIVKEVPDHRIDPKTGEPSLDTKTKVFLETIIPEEFVIDPVATSIDEALGCAHDTVKPRHEIEAMKREGMYMDKPLGAYSDEFRIERFAKGEKGTPDMTDQTRMTEWHGLVPRSMLEDAMSVGAELEIELELEDVGLEDDVEPDTVRTKDSDYDEELVESIITIANGGVLLKAVENPFYFKDRSIVAYGHDRVPNRFWARGVAEKGANIQRALDVELRARIDGLALSIHPMLAVDATRMPRGAKPSVGPGKTIQCNGDPRQILMPFNFGDINTQTFAQGGELERMIQMGTGAMDTATSAAASPRNSTASGMSMIASSSIKRTKRTMQNVDRDFLAPLIRKFAWRYMQFDNERYPVDDYLFLPRSSMGMMAREFEQSQMTNLLSMTPQDSPTFGLILSQIIDNSSGENKEEFKAAIKQMYEPPPPDPLQQKIQELEINKLTAEIQEIGSRAAQNVANAETRTEDSESTRMNAETNRLEAEAKIEDNELDRQADGNKNEKT